MILNAIFSLGFLMAPHLFLQVAAVDSGTSVPAAVQSAMKARESKDITPSDMSNIDRWIKADPRKACDYFISLERRGNIRATTFLKRIAERHHADKKASEVLIPNFLEDGFNFSFEFIDGTEVFVFHEDDYTTATKQWIFDAMRRSPSPKLFLACGAANMKQEIPFLKRFIVGADMQNNRLTRYARLACARMGDAEQLQAVIRDTKAHKSLKTFDMIELYMLGYTRQPAAIKYLQEILNGDERLPPVRMGDVGSPWSRVALDVLTKCLEDFPIQWISDRRYSDQDIAIARDWMNSQKEFKIIR